ncbi:MAG: ABC transporter permease [Chthoniobacterales bacterium]
MIFLQDLKLAFRNVFRNTRRSLVTITAIMLSCAGLILFAGYVAWAFRSAECHAVVIFSHIQLAKRGYFEKGAGNPAAYAIASYPELKQKLHGDPLIGPKLELVTGQILLKGIVSYAEARTSSTFVGLGVFPEEDWRFLSWNPYRLVMPLEIPANKDLYRSTPELASDDPDGASLGGGLARLLELTGTPRAQPQTEPTLSRAFVANDASSAEEADLAALSQEIATPEAGSSLRPSVELLCAPPGGGMPNAISLSVRRVFTRPTKELDNHGLKLNIHRASELLFPGEDLKVTSILLLLKRTSDMPAVVSRLKELILQEQLDLELRTWNELRPFYGQLRRLFQTMFTFMFCIIAVIVTFTIYNTLSMGIAERIPEIGTLRAMGVTRRGIMKSFLLEGLVLGLIGGLFGVLLAIVGELVINRLKIVYVPPGGAFYTQLEVLVLRFPAILAVCFGGALVAALLSAILPARHAAQLLIVDALRH